VISAMHVFDLIFQLLIVLLVFHMHQKFEVCIFSCSIDALLNIPKFKSRLLDLCHASFDLLLHFALEI